MVRLDLQLLFMILMEIVSVFAVDTTTKWTILWRPFLYPGNYYDRFDSPPDQSAFMNGSKCLDYCKNAFLNGPWICRYLMLEPLEEDWRKPAPGAIDFVDKVRDMRVKNCIFFEAQKLEGELAKKFYISKGFRNTINGEQGTHICLEFVAEVYQSWMWPNPFDDVVVPQHFEMDAQTAQYFEKTGNCPWNSGMITEKLEATSDIASTSTQTPTTDKVSTVTLFSMICGNSAAHSFYTPKCPNDDIPEILFESEFATTDRSDCGDMISFKTNALGWLYPASKEEAVGWCSVKKECGFDTPLYKLNHWSNGFVFILYGPSSNTKTTTKCYVKSSTFVNN